MASTSGVHRSRNVLPKEGAGQEAQDNGQHLWGALLQECPAQGGHRAEHKQPVWAAKQCLKGLRGGA